MSGRTKKNSRKVKFSDGLYIAVDADGYVVNGTTNGPKLYIKRGTAIRWAGPGGTVLHVSSLGIAQI